MLYIPEVEGVQLEDWLEDKNRFSRYTLADQKDESVWVCTQCDHLACECTCGDNLAEDLDIA